MTRYLALLLLPMAFTAQASQLDLKTGAWELTTSGGPIPKPMTEKECMTQADIAQFSTGGKDDDSECRYDKPPALSGKTWSGEKTCPGGRKMRAEFTAESPERVRGVITLIYPGKVTSMQVTGKWLGASCKGID